jgi:hypothetical protein
MNGELMMSQRTRATFGLLFFFGATWMASAAELQITVENLQPQDGFFFTPVWFGLHDGGFDLFDIGSPATSQLATLAEIGDVAPLSELFLSSTNANASMRADGVLIAPAGFPGAPVFDPSESITANVMVTDPMSNRYFSFASMVIPSNDAFFGNSNPMAYQLFAPDGSFSGPITIDILGRNIYDAGSELNDQMGAAFSAIGGMDTDETANVMLHPGLDAFLGTETAAGSTLMSSIGPDTVVARIHINAVPEPAGISLLIFGLAAVSHPLRKWNRTA